MQLKINITDNQQAMMVSMIRDGYAESIEEAVERSISAMEKQHEEKIEAIRAALVEGEESGIIKDFSFKDFRKELDDELGLV